jgi:peptidoglycan L-alanyl-D-glutamate endopeptidase CwlK
MRKIADAFKAAGKELKIPIVWGGDWKSFVDMPHVELDRRVYK